MDLAAVLWRLIARMGIGRAAFDPAMMVALLLYAYALGDAVVAGGSSGAARRMSPTRVICRQPGARITRRSRAFVSATRSAGRAVRRGARALRRGRPGRGRGDRGRRHEGARQRVRARDRDYEQIAREILAEADAVDAEEDERFGERRGDELPEQLATGAGRAKWLAEAKRRLEQRRAEEARPIPARGRGGCGRPSGAWKRSTRPSAGPTPPMRPIGRAADAQGRRRVRLAAEALHAAGDAAGQDQHDRPRLAQRQDAARLGAGLQRPGRRQRATRS